jgi:uncharacterized cupredoxin-like copper-binding protein
MKKAILILILLSGFFKANAQHSINDYKYVIVQKQFHFQNEANEYNLNELTRFLLKKQGFRPVLESDIYPDDLKSNYCLALISEVTAKGMLRTIVTITLRDCNNNIIFQAEGITKEKDFDKLYSYGIRKAFEDFKVLDYNYVPNEAITNKAGTKSVETVIDDSAEVEKLKSEIENLKKEKAEKELKDQEEAAKKLKDDADSLKDTIKVKPKKSTTILEAIANDNGYDLVNAESKKLVHVLTKTGMDNVFTVKGNNGIIYKKEGKWVWEYTKGKKTVVETLSIIF